MSQKNLEEPFFQILDSLLSPSQISLCFQQNFSNLTQKSTRAAYGALIQLRVFLMEARFSAMTMEPPLPSLRTLFLICFILSISASVVGKSQSQDSASRVTTPPPPPPPQSPFPPPPPIRLGHNKAYNENHHRRRYKPVRHHHPPPPSPKKQKLNTGKTVGILFAGISAVLQVGVAGFLLHKRRQLLKVKDRY